jgi:multicomponent Na+:H+ antiporter subunit G
MIEWIVAVCMILGGLLMLLGAVGVLRMPDLFTRMQTATKPAILGSALLALAVTLHFGDVWVAARAVMISGFFALTAPVGAHVIARAAYFAGIRLWEHSVRDDLRGRYDEQTHKLESPSQTDLPDREL